MKITVIGSGYVGLVSGACLADLGNDVLCLDVDQKKIELNLFEPDEIRTLNLECYPVGRREVC